MRWRRGKAERREGRAVGREEGGKGVVGGKRRKEVVNVAKRKGRGRKKGKKKKGSILRSKRTARLMELAKAKNRPYVVRSIKRGRTGVIRNRKKDYRWGIRKNKKALPPGWRVSRTGRLYYEARRNRSDSPRSRI